MPVTTSPRQLKLFDPATGGFARFIDIGEPLQIASGEPIGGEALEVRWLEPTGFLSIRKFFNNFDIFLENNVSTAPISQIPDEQLLASVSMAAILAGEVHPGTKEFLEQVASDQNSANFQTILLDCKLKAAAVVNTGNPLTDGNTYDLTFMRLGQTSNTKVVQSDIISISKYVNRANTYAVSVPCVPGAVTKQFGKLKTADLGASDSAIRTDIVNFLQAQRFYA